ncbi:gas vesicle protein GvpG [Nonomuraea jabiensis]|uniref:Cytochrome c-type biogenesis protein CcmH/NrfG n=1 Tax=Nonomuraea jabiensis TaxID=882448 RepID=A0A7W9GFA0_9ACTN|nr:gas vesicle protein GvpG [Nonomuraea jabiensis]MBB5782724.1 cytochrome c-type biogenesis protein CcmH/NrfG [Nonomuraea jabiensis]
MGLISLLFGWPVAPLRGVIRLGELIQEEVEREMRDPTVVRHRLEEIEAARAAGLISEEEEALQTREVLQGMIGGPGPVGRVGGPARWDEGR